MRALFRPALALVTGSIRQRSSQFHTCCPRITIGSLLRPAAEPRSQSELNKARFGFSLTISRSMTIYEEIRRELRWKKRMKLIRLGLKKVKKKKKKKGTWNEPCLLPNLAPYWEPPYAYVIGPHQDAQMWPNQQRYRLKITQ